MEHTDRQTDSQTHTHTHTHTNTHGLYMISYWFCFSNKSLASVSQVAGTLSTTVPGLIQVLSTMLKPRFIKEKTDKVEFFKIKHFWASEIPLRK
jgi:hypothetical protein